METSLAHTFPQPQEKSTTPAELLALAISKGADVDQLGKLMELQLRWEANEARKAFVVAMNAFKASPPTILKNKRITAGPATYDYATLDSVCRAVIQHLSLHGISHRWKMEQDKDWIKVTCILTHELGHSEETALHGAPDQTGSKNGIQAIGSTVTYLQRYTLLSACGLAAANQDTDGRAPGLESDKVAEQIEWLANAHTLDELKRLFKNAYQEAERAKDRLAMSKYITAKNKRKAELQC